MRPVLRAAEQHALDRQVIESFGLPSFTLMENAGRGAAAALMRHWDSLRGKRLLVLCGSGNNGGDGLVVARVLREAGARVHVQLLGEPKTADSKANLKLLTRLCDLDGASIESNLIRPQVSGLPPCDAIIDALFGVGLSRPLRGVPARLVALMNEANVPVAALDMPTGLEADSGHVLGAAVRADLTLTMGSLKPGLLLNEGPVHAGRIEVIDIGTPRGMVHSSIWLTTDHAAAEWIPQRGAQPHKYSAGTALVIGGAAGMGGAAVMASSAAARIGAGYVACAVPQSNTTTVAGHLTEIPVIGLPESAGGGIDPKGAREMLAPWLQKAHALLIGPGLGRHADTQVFVQELLRDCSLPAVVDADGLYAVDREFLAAHAGGRWILTPHEGELRGLIGTSLDLRDRVEVAQTWANGLATVLVVKGLPSIVGVPGGGAVICGTGNSALATAGTGDVLAGLCVGLLAQGCEPGVAAALGLHIGGAAADRYASRLPGGTMIAADLITETPAVIGDLMRNQSAER